MFYCAKLLYRLTFMRGDSRFNCPGEVGVAEKFGSSSQKTYTCFLVLPFASCALLGRWLKSWRCGIGYQHLFCGGIRLCVDLKIHRHTQSIYYQLEVTTTHKASLSTLETPVHGYGEHKVSISDLVSSWPDDITCLGSQRSAFPWGTKSQHWVGSVP